MSDVCRSERETLPSLQEKVLSVVKILFLSKRRPMGRDLLNRPYGRFYHLPQSLAQKNHDVTILLASYKKEQEEQNHIDEDGVRWYSFSPRIQNPLRYYFMVSRLVSDIKPDWIIGFSDTYYGILAQHFAQRFKCRSMIDAYDNYESYLPWCRPLHFLWRKSLAKADLVTAAGPNLSHLMGQNRKNKPTVILRMAADPIGFQPRDKSECRKKLGLPLDKTLIGYCGSIHHSRGIETLFQAVEIIQKHNTNIELILTGTIGPNINIPTCARWFGYLPEENMPTLLNSMDVTTVINRQSSFGNFSYPVKLYEAMCCQIPVVATRTRATEWILAKNQDLLVDAGNPIELSAKITQALQRERIDYGQEQGWEEVAEKLEKYLRDSR